MKDWPSKNFSGGRGQRGLGKGGTYRKQASGTLVGRPFRGKIKKEALKLLVWR